MIKHPHGAWIWELAKIRRDYLERLKQQNCKRVYLKVFDGRSHPMFWGFQCSKAIVNRFHNEGIEVYGWGYHYGTSDINTQVNAVRQALDCGIDGYILDLEQEIKERNTHDNVKKLIQAVRPYVKPGTLGYTSFGHPGLHPEIPWRLLDDLCDLALPQIYFEKWRLQNPNNDEAEVRAAIEAHKRLGLKKPILPIWGSEEDATRPATVATLQNFLTQYPGSSVFRIPHVGQKGEAWNLDYAGKELVLEENEPLITAKPNKALFRMQLQDSTGLIVGHLFLFDASGQQVFDAVATSGQPGYQSLDDLWKPTQGPIPNLAGLEIETEGTVIESRDINGLFFPISPNTLEHPSEGITRGGFGVYNDAGAPGTSGGIAIANPQTYEHFCDLMANARKAGTTKIALRVEYSGRSKAALKPARALFRMQLANTSRMLWGNLFLFDANVLGSSGCIVIQNKHTFERFCDVMANARRAGINLVPLEVDYPGARSIPTLGKYRAKGISIHIGLNRVDEDHYQGWDGQLEGCENDAKAMHAIANQQGFNSQLILTEQATSTRVKQTLTEAAKQLESGDMLLLTFSGHGGQVPNLNGDEEDNQDETWVLHDRELLDDELYTLYGQFKEGVRIFVLSDSCHSGTVTRSRLYKTLFSTESIDAGGRESEEYSLRTAERPRIRVMPQEHQNRTYYAHQGLYRRIQKANREFNRNNVAASVILISGCQDNQLSLDGFPNGFFTQMLLEVWNQGEFQGEYRDFRRDIGLRMPPWQSPHYYTVGVSNPDFESQIPFTVNVSNGDSGEEPNWDVVPDFNWDKAQQFSNDNGHNFSSEVGQDFSDDFVQAEV